MTTGLARETRAERQLRALAESWTGRPCLMLPSGRLALYLALRHWFQPGDRVLMSPINDDVVLFVVLAAGLRPVSAPVSPWTGNIDPAAIPEHTWKSVAGVLTTNLYGLPDPVIELRQRCDRLGLTLIEDASHAIDSAIERRPIGTFGTAGAYSLSKHASAMTGGFLAVADAEELPTLERLRDQLTTGSATARDALTVAKSAARPWVKRSPIGGPLWMTMQHLHLHERGGGYRMPLRPDDLEDALAHAPDLDAFDPWVRVDLSDYRRRSGSLLAWWSRKRLQAVDTDRRARLDGVARLVSLPWATPAIREDGQQREPTRPMFRVPLFVLDRDNVVATLARHGVVTGYVYDPPLDDYAGPSFMDPSPSPEPARWFARHALPADPLDAKRTARVLQEIGARAARWTGTRPDPPSPPGTRRGRR